MEQQATVTFAGGEDLTSPTSGSPRYASRRQSLSKTFVPTTGIIPADTEEECMLSIEGARLRFVQGERREDLDGKWELQLVEVASCNVAPAALARIGVTGTPPAKLVFLCFDTGSQKQHHLLTRPSKPIVLKEDTAVFKYQYTLVLPGRFLEFRLPADEYDEEDLDELEEEGGYLEVLDSLLRQHASFRDKNSRRLAHQDPVPVTEKGRLLEKGIGDHVGRHIRGSAHFIAKRVHEYQGALLLLAEKMTVSTAKGALPACPPGGGLRLSRQTLANMRAAHLITRNASESARSNVTVLLRKISREVGVACGNDTLATQVGQRMAGDRTLRELRKVLLAAITAYEELSGAIYGVPGDAQRTGVPRGCLQSAARASVDIIDHMWGPAAAELGGYALGMVVEKLMVKWDSEHFVDPAANAMVSARAFLQVLCEPPSAKCQRNMELKAERESREEADRLRLLRKLRAPAR